MREIKFRAWHPTNKEMVVIDTKIGANDPSIALQFCALMSNVHPEGKNLLMQFTGLLDKSGKEIYEGDIVKFTYWWFDGNEAESTLTGTIVYSDELMSFQLKGVKNEEWEKHTGHENDTEYLTAFSELCFEEADFEVIGNVFESTESQ